VNSRVDAYIASLEPSKQELAIALRNVIISTVPGIDEKLSFKIPFYHYFGMFCYLNKVKEGLDLGFCRGKDLIDEFPQLQLKNRAMVASLPICSLRDIQQLNVKEIIVTAAIWYEEAAKQKISFVRSSSKGKKNPSTRRDKLDKLL
jgi:hypothetical protein